MALRLRNSDSLFRSSMILELVDVNLQSAFMSSESTEQDGANLVHVLRGQSAEHTIRAIRS